MKFNTGGLLLISFQQESHFDQLICDKIEILNLNLRMNNNEDYYHLHKMMRFKTEASNYPRTW
jgi:hypothetical protein